MKGILEASVNTVSAVQSQHRPGEGRFGSQRGGRCIELSNGRREKECVCVHLNPAL